MLYFNCGRLHINAFYFFEKRDFFDMEGLAELFSIACKVIDNVKTLFQTNNPAGSCPLYVHRTMTLAAFTVLRISKSPVAPYLDLKSGEKSYFSTIVFLRRSSLENDDLYARGAMILTQLWTSAKVFKKPDGTVDSLSLRIRSRLSMSVVFDCFWWWREEFDGKPSPFQDLENSTAKGNARIPDHNRVLMYILKTRTLNQLTQPQKINEQSPSSLNPINRFSPLLKDDSRITTGQQALTFQLLA